MTALQPYPTLNSDDPEDLMNAINTISRIRLQDIAAFNRQNAQINNASNYAGFYVDVRAYGALPDGLKVQDMACSSGSPTATSATANFSIARDTGKQIKIYDIINNAYIFQGTILSVQSATHITLSGNALASLTAGNGIAYWGTDYSTQIQAALNVAASYVATDTVSSVNFPVGLGKVTVVFPTSPTGDAYLFNSTLTVGTNVILSGPAVLLSNVGFGASDRTWAITATAPGAQINGMSIFTGGGMGINWGTTGDPSNTTFANLEIWDVGTNYNSGLSPTSQIGIQTTGYNYKFNNVFVKNGNIGIHLNQTSDVFIDPLTEVVGSATAIQFTSVENCSVFATLDTISYEGLSIDGSRNIAGIVRMLNNSTATLTYGAAFGQYDSTDQNEAINITLNMQRTGGTCLYIAYTSDSIFNVNMSNTATYSGEGEAITQAVQYGSGNAGNIVVNVFRDGTSVTTLSSGSITGALLDYNDGIVSLAGGSIGLPTAANGAVATTMTSVGPTGSHTTVQEWLTIKNLSGTTRYIPCY